jgi:hypothetical protein
MMDVIGKKGVDDHGQIGRPRAHHFEKRDFIHVRKIGIHNQEIRFLEASSMQLSTSRLLLASWTL